MINNIPWWTVDAFNMYSSFEIKALLPLMTPRMPFVAFGSDGSATGWTAWGRSMPLYPASIRARDPPRRPKTDLADDRDQIAVRWWLRSRGWH